MAFRWRADSEWRYAGGPIANGVSLAGPIVNGVSLAGPMVYGASLVGPILNGVSLAGPIVKGVSLAGPIVNGVSLAADSGPRLYTGLVSWVLGWDNASQSNQCVHSAD